MKKVTKAGEDIEEERQETHQKVPKICSTHGTVTPVIIAHYGPKTLHALVDTGAGLNLLADRHAPPHLKRNSTNRIRLACQEAYAEVVGEVEMRLTIGQQEFYVNCCVVEDLAHDLILGTPFLQTEQATLDFGRGCLHLGKKERQTVYWSRAPTENQKAIELPELSENHPVELQELLDNFATIFEVGLVQPTTRTTKHQIVLKEDKVVNQRCYNLNPTKRKILYEQVEEMLAAGVIEPTNSAFSSPPILVERPGKSPRFCVDYRALNAITADESAALPRIQDALKALQQAKIFSVLYLKSGYWQIPLTEESKKYTAFSTPDGAAYQFTVMPFGLKNAPSTFQKLMTTEVLVGFIQEFTQVYLDDIIVYSNDMASHLRHLHLVFERLQQHNLKVSAAKCRLCTDALDYLGYRVQEDMTVPQTKHLEQVKNFKRPQTKRQLQSFLGTCNWLREHVPNLAALTAPLAELLKKGNGFRWKEIHEKAFSDVKEAVAQPVALHRPDPSRKFVLQTDASQIGMSAVLYQEKEDGTRQIVSHASAKFGPTESKYHVNEQECLALVWAIKYYRHFLEDRHFIVRTDSRALTWLEKFKDTRAKLTRWALMLQEYSFAIEHVPGSKNELPDFLSRNPSKDTPYHSEPDNERLVPPTSPGEDPPDGIPMVGNINAGEMYDKIARAQAQVPYIRRTKVTIRLIQEQGGPQSAMQRRLVDRFAVYEELLWKRGPDKDRLVVPRKLVPQLLYAFHDHREKAHPGTEETYQQLARYYYWGYMRRDVEKYVRQCIICSACKTQQRQRAAPMLARSPEYPFQMISIDLLGPYPEALRTKNRYILLAEDVFSKWVEAKTYEEVTLQDVIRFIRDEVIARYGTPQVLVTDNGKIFTGRRLEEFCEENRIEHRFSSVYHQRANPVERRVQELKKVLKVLLYQRRDILWEQELPKALQVLRSRINRATGETPASIVLGYELPVPGAWTQKWPQARKVLNPQERRDRNRRIFARQLKFQQEYNDPSEPPVSFRAGDRVNVRQRKADAFAPSWTGPHEIVQKTGPTTYEVLIEGGQWNVHVDDLRPAKPGNRVDFAEDGYEQDSEESDSDSDPSEFEFPPNHNQPPLANRDDSATDGGESVTGREERVSEEGHDIAEIAVAWLPSREGNTSMEGNRRKSNRPCKQKAHMSKELRQAIRQRRLIAQRTCGKGRGGPLHRKSGKPPNGALRK